MVNNELLVPKSNSLTADILYVSCQFGNIAWTDAKTINGLGYVIHFALLSNFFSLGANLNS